LPFVVRSDLGRFSGDSRRPLMLSGRDVDAIEAELYSHLTPVRRRLWTQRSLLLIVRALVLFGIASAVGSFLQFADLPIPMVFAQIVGVGIGLWVLGLIFRQRVTYFDVARVLDRRLDLNQVIGTAVELTSSSVETRLARLQTRRATEIARRIDSADAVRFGLPVRDLQALVVCMVLTATFLYLSTVRIAWPGTPNPDDFTSEPDLAQLFETPFLPTSYEGDMMSGALDPELFDRSLDGYMQDLEGQNLSPEELAARIAEIQAQLAQRAEALNRQRQALAELADALIDSSASSDAADSIRRGDFQKAAQQLGELGKQAAQLSQRGRRDLAQRLDQSASRVAPNSQELASRMRRSAQALAGSDPAQMEQSLRELAEGVEQAGEQIRQLADSGSEFDPSSMDNMDPSGGAASGELGQEGLGGLSDYEGAGEAGDFGEGFGDSSGMLDSPDQGLPGNSARADMLGAEAGTGSAASGALGKLESGLAADRANPENRARVIELRGRPSDSGSSTIDSNDRVPLVSSNDGTIGGSAGATGRSIIVDPLSMRGEQNFVPWEKRQIIKDYFTGSTR
jgi:hypothetical protein